MASTTAALLAWSCAGLMAWGAGDDAQTSRSQVVIRPPDSFFELVPDGGLHLLQRGAASAMVLNRSRTATNRLPSAFPAKHRPSSRNACAQLVRR